MRAPRDLRSPISLPEKTSGKFRIKHRNYPPGAKLPIVSFRTAYMTGQKASAALFIDGLRVHELFQKDQGVWMTDIPQELVQMRAFARSARGKVLIGGLGLGLLAHFVAQKDSVAHVDIVENSKDVIKLCWNNDMGTSREILKKCRVYEADLYKFLKGVKTWRWDRAYFDIWQGTNEVTWHNTVLPLKRLVANRFGNVNVKYWAENEMLGQVAQTLQGYTMCPDNSHPWAWYRAFRAAAANIGYPFGKKPPEIGTKEYWEARTKIETDPKHQRLIRVFVLGIGLPRWEQVFGSYA